MEKFFTNLQEWFAQSWQFTGIQQWMAELIASVINLFKDLFTDTSDDAGDAGDAGDTGDVGGDE